MQRAIRDDRWKLIRYPQVNRTQLFDLQSDPQERNDLFGKSEGTAKVAELTARLETALKQYGDQCPLTVANPKPAEWSPTPKETKGAKKNKNKKDAASPK